MVRHDRVQYREKETRERTEARCGRLFWSWFLYQHVKQRMQSKKKKKRSELVLYEDRLLFSTAFAFTKLLMTKHCGSHAILHQ